MGWPSLAFVAAVALEAPAAAHSAPGSGAGGLRPVTAEVVLDHAGDAATEVAARSEIGWADHGRRIVLSAIDPQRPDGSAATPERVLSVEVGTGRVTELGQGSRPSAAVHGDLVAFLGESGRELRVVDLQGRSLCALLGRDLVDAGGAIQALAVSPDGQRIALALERPPTPATKASSTLALDGARVTVMSPRLAAATGEDAELWIVSRACGQPLRVAVLPQVRIGRLAWSPDGRAVVGLVATTGNPLQHVRTDLLLFDPTARSSRILRADVGGQARADSDLVVSPSGEEVALIFDADALPYRVRKQAAVISLRDGATRLVTKDPRRAAGWLNRATLLLTRMAAHPLRSSAVAVGPDGTEHEIGGARGALAPSPDGRQAATLTVDLYGNATLEVAAVRADARGFQLGPARVIWRRPSPLSAFRRAPRELLACEGSDGVRPAAILVLPEDYRPGRRYPLVVDVHGGPGGGLVTSRHPYVPGSIFNATTLEHDLWAARGYAVLVPDYRSSGLYGYDRISRNGDFFAQDLRDIMCNVDALIARGVADPQRMAVLGHSHGAMEVNWIITHSDRFRAAVSYEGVWNIHFGISWAAEGAPNVLLSKQFGTPIEAPERYRRMSVMDAVGGVSTPTLFIENKGGGRPGVSYAWLYAALAQQGVDTELRRYEERRHSLTGRVDRADLLRAVLRWVDWHLAGAGAEPAARR